jgi:hypothetical protein
MRRHSYRSSVEIMLAMELPDNVWSAAGLQGKSLGDRQVCGNVFGLSVEIISPGHDEFRCVPVFTSRSVVVNHFRDQVEGTPL